MRQVTSLAGGVTDTYNYDAFGNLLSSPGPTPNNYLYRGEQYDSDLGLYYLRARYYNTMTGRFVSMDPENGIMTDPATLHKYLYANGDPVNLADPTGRAGEEVVKPYSPGALEYGLIIILVSMEAAKAVPQVTQAAACLLDTGSSLLQGLTTDIIAPIKNISLDFGTCSAKVKRRHGCECEASCTAHEIGTPNHANTGQYYTGYGTGSDCTEARIAAKNNAGAQMPPGCHAQHCGYDCTEF